MGPALVTAEPSELCVFGCLDNAKGRNYNRCGGCLHVALLAAVVRTMFASLAARIRGRDFSAALHLLSERCEAKVE
jgi:hypothetical protein